MSCGEVWVLSFCSNENGMFTAVGNKLFMRAQLQRFGRTKLFVLSRRSAACLWHSDFWLVDWIPGWAVGGWLSSCPHTCRTVVRFQCQITRWIVFSFSWQVEPHFTIISYLPLGHLMAMMEPKFQSPQLMFAASKLVCPTVIFQYPLSGLERLTGTTKNSSSCSYKVGLTDNVFNIPISWHLSLAQLKLCLSETSEICQKQCTTWYLIAS